MSEAMTSPATEPFQRVSDDPAWPARHAHSQRLLRPVIRHHVGLACAGLGFVAVVALTVAWASGALSNGVALTAAVCAYAGAFALKVALQFALAAAAERRLGTDWAGSLRQARHWAFR